MPRLHSSIWLGAGMLAISAFLGAYLIPTWVIKPDNIRILVLSPDFWPYIITALLAIGGAAILLQYLVLGPNGADSGEEQEADDETARRGGLRVVLIGVLMLGYYQSLPFIGMIWASVLAYIAFMVLIGFPRKKAALVSSVVLPLILYAFFNYAAGVPIPQAEFLTLP